MIPRPWNELQRTYWLLDTERPLLARYIANVPQDWVDLFRQTEAQSIIGEWVGVFRDPPTEDPILVLEVTDRFRPNLVISESTALIPARHQRYRVGSHSRSLIPIPVHLQTDLEI